jgi:hypothetical protein
MNINQYHTNIGHDIPVLMLCDEILSSIQSVCSFIPLLYDAISTVGHAMTQSPASHLRVRGQYCGICGEPSGAGTVLSPSSVLHCQYNSTVAFHTHVSSGDEKQS